MWEIYDALLEGLPSGNAINRVLRDDWWTLAETEAGGLGLAMTTEGDTRPPMYPNGVAGLRLRVAAAAIKSWNLPEAAFGMAAINAFCNTPERMAELHCEEPYDNYCTEGLQISGKTVGLIGHLKLPARVLRDAKQVYILERHPQTGDYPDSACDYLLPSCDVVLITGSSLVNKTLPHLLELCKNAYVILTGPTTPMCPALLDCGIDRLAGLVVTDKPGVRAHITGNIPGPPFRYGQTFLLKREK